MFKFKVYLIAFGVFIIYTGYREFKVSQFASSTPSEVELSTIEKNPYLKNNYLTIDNYLAVFPASLYHYKKNKFSSKEPTEDTTVTATYYPIVSNDHPYVIECDALALKYGGYENIPKDEWPEFNKFAVLVKTDKFKTIGDIPREWQEKKTITGLVIDEIDPLDAEEKALIRESFPYIRFRKLHILEEGRSPSSNIASFGMMGGGVLVCIFSVYLMSRRKR